MKPDRELTEAQRLTNTAVVEAGIVWHQTMPEATPKDGFVAGATWMAWMLDVSLKGGPSFTIGQIASAVERAAVPSEYADRLAELLALIQAHREQKGA